jgi:hypothetical protein
MERMQNDHLPMRKADVDTLKRDLEQVYRTVKTTGGDRREQTAAAPFRGMVITGK